MQTRINANEREIFELFGIGIRQLRQMRMANTGPKFIKISGEIGKTGGRVVYPIAAVERWLETQPTGGAAEVSASK